MFFYPRRSQIPKIVFSVPPYYNNEFNISNGAIRNRNFPNFKFVFPNASF